jgi:hypothetical protein
MHRTVRSRRTTSWLPISRVGRRRRRGRAGRQRTTFINSITRQSCDDELTIIAERLADRAG